MALPEPMKAPSIDHDAFMTKKLADREEWLRRANIAQAKAAQAFARLLKIAEESDTGQARRIALFLAGTFNGRAYPFGRSTWS